MLTPEQLSSPGYLLSKRQRDERILLTAVTRATSSMRDIALKYTNQVNPVQMYAAWEDSLVETFNKIEMDGDERAYLLTELKNDTMPDEMYQSVREVIYEATANSFTTTQLREALEEALDLNHGETQITASLRSWGMSWRSRIKRKARTLSTRFNAWITQNGIWIIGIEHKRWVTRRDPYVRASHEAIDGMTILSHEYFPVGGYSLQYPGDGSGPAEEVINCRCVLTAVLRP